jgi:hypothetical protein
VFGTTLDGAGVATPVATLLAAAAGAREPTGC